MIVFLALGLFFVGLVTFEFYTIYKTFTLEVISRIGLIIGSVPSLVLISVAVVNNFTANTEIIVTSTIYENLVERLEYKNNHPNNVNDTELFSEIQDWNLYVGKMKYCNDSIWFDVLCNDKLVDGLKYIPIGDI